MNCGNFVEHNGKRSGGDKSGDMPIKRQRVDEEMQVAFERNANNSYKRTETANEGTRESD